MSNNLEKTLINRIKHLTKQHCLYYEFLLVDNKYQTVNKGYGEISIAQFKGIDRILIENIKNTILKDLPQNSNDYLDFSTENVFLSSVLELRNEPLENSGVNIDVELKKLLSELKNRKTKFDSTQMENLEKSKEYLSNIYVSKIFNIYQKLAQESKIDRQQILYEELASMLRFLPEQIQQLLLDFFNKVS